MRSLQLCTMAWFMHNEESQRRSQKGQVMAIYGIILHRFGASAYSVIVVSIQCYNVCFVGVSSMV